MNKTIIISLLLAGCCLLSGCSKTASDGDEFPAPGGSGAAVRQTPEGEDAAASPEPGQDSQDSAAPEGGGETDAPPEETGPEDSPPSGAGPFIDEAVMSEDVNLGDELIPMSAAPAAVPTVLSPVASGTAVKTGGGAEIDYSNTKDGYVMARFAAANSKRLRVQVAGPTTTYTYDLPTGKWVTFPLSDGSGSYKTTVLQNTTGKKYAVLASASFQVALADEFAPFLRPNQYVDYEGAVNTIAMAAELTRNVTKPLDKVGVVYNYVVSSLSYDRDKAASVTSGYLPDLDSVLASKTGICFDYAALMTGMLRSQGVPCKLVVGYAGTTYHAWVSVWTQETGWVDSAIYFDGTTWHRMDPTFASSGGGSDQIMQYIGNGSNYTVKYLY